MKEFKETHQEKIDEKEALNQFLMGWNELLRKEKENAESAIANLKEQNAVLEGRLEKEKSEFAALEVGKQDLYRKYAQL